MSPFLKGIFFCPPVIHTPNVKRIGQSIVELLQENHFQMMPPGASFPNALSTINPNTKFEVNQLKHSQTTQKQYVPSSTGRGI